MPLDFVTRVPLKASIFFGVLWFVLAPVKTLGQRGDVVISGRNEAPPQLVFACDGPTDALERLFSQPDVIADLRELKAAISLSLPELNDGRARIVVMLNQAGIPVTAWLALPESQGYYLNAGNASAATERFAEFERWSSANGLRWAGIGLDIEPNIQEFATLKQSSKWHIATTMIGRYFDEARVQRARESYGALIREMQAHGYFVETYQFPFLADERRVHSTLLQRLFGIVDVKGDQEVLMLYTAFNRRLGAALLWVYGPDAQAIAVGSTMGSKDAPQFVPLSWEEFSRDLIVAHHFSRIIGVYNLEGCVRQGFLQRLKTMNWTQSVTIPAESVRGAEMLRTRVQRVIWIVSRLPYIAVMAFVVIAGSIVVWRMRSRRPA